MRRAESLVSAFFKFQREFRIAGLDKLASETTFGLSITVMPTPFPFITQNARTKVNWRRSRTDIRRTADIQRGDFWTGHTEPTFCQSSNSNRAQKERLLKSLDHKRLSPAHQNVAQGDSEA